MDIITTDAETYWAKDYSVADMSPLEYVTDDRFELICLSLKVNDGPTEVFFGIDNIRKAIKQVDWSKSFVVGHNMSGFDSYIYAYRLGIKPLMWGCTLAMARPIHAKTTGLSLAKLVEHYKLGKKDNSILLSTKGKRLADFTSDELRAMNKYNVDDTDQCYALFKLLAKHYTPRELWQIDAVIRMRTEPQFKLDVPLLETALSIERDRKLKALLDLWKLLDVEYTDDNPEDARTEADFAEEVRAQLASAPKFSALLEKLGVEVPMKFSPTDPDKEIPALAKSDEEFIALLDHENPIVAAAARTRLDVKSTLLETRIEKFLTAGDRAGGLLPIPLRYCGADTTGRDSGEEYNPQNLPRINPDKPKHTDALRRSLRAPDGYKVIVADQSGIELRVNHFLWQVPYSTELYRSDPVADLYKAYASRAYAIAVEQITKPQRQYAKAVQLGCGFGVGADKFRVVAKVQGGLDLSLTESLSAVTQWREQHPEIVKGWRKCHDSLPVILSGREQYVDPCKLVHTCREGLVLPSGRLIRYPNLRQEKDDNGSVEWWYGDGRNKARIYAGKIDENIVQALARDSIFDCAVEFYRQTNLRPALRVHDELVYVVPDAKAAGLLARLQDIMRTPPAWWTDLVVWSEGDVADNYGDAK